jgi:hypothetical protein
MFKLKYVIIPILVIFLIVVILFFSGDKFVRINSTIKGINICQDKTTICSIEITYTYNNFPYNNYIYPSDGIDASDLSKYTIGHVIPIYILEKSPEYIYLNITQNKTSLYVILFITILLIAFFAIKK